MKKESVKKKEAQQNIMRGVKLGGVAAMGVGGAFAASAATGSAEEDNDIVEDGATESSTATTASATASQQSASTETAASQHIDPVHPAADVQIDGINVVPAMSDAESATIEVATPEETIDFAPADIQIEVPAADEIDDGSVTIISESSEDMQFGEEVSDGNYIVDDLTVQPEDYQYEPEDDIVNDYEDSNFNEIDDML